MRKTVSFEIGEATTKRSALRRRVVYFPDAEMNQKFEDSE